MESKQRTSVLKALMKSQETRKNQIRMGKINALGINNLTAKFFAPLIERQDKTINELQKLQQVTPAIAPAPSVPAIEAGVPPRTSTPIIEEPVEGMSEILERLEANRSNENDNSFLKYSGESNGTLIYHSKNRLVSVNQEGTMKYFMGEVLDSSKSDKLTPGLAELLFVYNFDESKVTQEDLRTYFKVMKKINAPKTKSKRMDRINALRGEESFASTSGSDLVLDSDISPVHGQGLNPVQVIIPTSIHEVKKKLGILLAANKEGHTNTFNEINALLDYLLKTRNITGLKYRTIISGLKE